MPTKVLLCGAGGLIGDILEAARLARVKKIFYSSSACIYPQYNQTDPANPKCSEDSAYPAALSKTYTWIAGQIG